MSVARWREFFQDWQLGCARIVPLDLLFEWSTYHEYYKSGYIALAEVQSYEIVRKSMYQKLISRSISSGKRQTACPVLDSRR